MSLAGIQVIQRFTEDRRVLSRQLHRIGGSKENGTLLRDAIVSILDNLLRGVEGRKAVVFLTDGQDIGSKNRMDQLKRAVYLSDALLYGLLVDTERDVLKTMQQAEARFSRLSLVIDASSSLRVGDVKQAALSLVDLLPASAPVCLVEHRARRRAVLLLPYTSDRTQLKDAINKARAEPRSTDTPSTWKASGMTILITDSDADLPQRIQDDIRNQAAILVLGKRSANEWQKQLKDFASSFPDPSDLKRAMNELPAKYRDELDNFYELIAEELRRTYSLGYYSGAAPRQYHRLEVKLRAAGQANVRARRGFLLP